MIPSAMTVYEWRKCKAVRRHRAYMKRMRQTREADQREWLAAVKRDDYTDRHERRWRKELRYAEA
jgi:hypothetical protein